MNAKMAPMKSLKNFQIANTATIIRMIPTTALYAKGTVVVWLDMVEFMDYQYWVKFKR